MLKGNVLIGQSGGPTSVINSTLAGAVHAGRESSEHVTGVYGMRWGIEGFMAAEVIDLTAEKDSTIEMLRRTPSSILGSSRHKVTDEDLPLILKRLKEFNIRTICMIGGNDTMDTINRVTDYAASQGYEMCGIGAPKTVDNDLYGTDHTPGYASAARYTALSVQQSGRLARDMQKVDQFVIYQSIGRDAGWLTAASALAKKDPSDPPHLVYMPERVFDANKFLADAEKAYKNYGFVSIACGEGIKYADDLPVSASRTTDKFANVEYGAMGGSSVALNMHRMISDAFGWRGEFQITESLCMASFDRAVATDLEEAYQCGRKAIELAVAGETGVMVSIVRDSNDPYKCSYATAPLSDVAVRAKPMPDEMINDEGNFPTQAFFDYALPMTGELPQYANLEYIKATSK